MQRHVGSEGTTPQPFNTMIARGSTPRGNNQPNLNIEQVDESRNTEHRKKQTPAYLRKQLSLRGWRPPTEHIKDVSID